MSRPDSIEFIARGVMIHGGSILLCRNLKRGYYYLPGGHVEFGERASDALAREIQEETGASARVGALLATAEVAFHDGRRKRHELDTLFHVEQFEELLPVAVSREPEIAFAWVPLDELATVDFRPTCLIEWLRSRRPAHIESFE